MEDHPFLPIYFLLLPLITHHPAFDSNFKKIIPKNPFQGSKGAYSWVTIIQLRVED